MCARSWQAAGGSTDDIIKMTVWMADRSQRDVLNAEWLKMFPDEHVAPRAPHLAGRARRRPLIQCDITAVFA